jgi:hypothetical protein
MFCNKKLNWIKRQVDSNVKLIINNLCIPALNIKKLSKHVTYCFGEDKNRL